MRIQISLLQCRPVSLQQLPEFLALLLKPPIKHKKSIPHRKNSRPTIFAAGTDDERCYAKKRPHHIASASGRLIPDPAGSQRGHSHLPEPCGVAVMGPSQQDALRELHTQPGRSSSPISHRRGTGCQKGLGSLLQQPHLGSFKAVVWGCETHAGLSAKVYVVFKWPGLMTAPLPPQG